MTIVTDDFNRTDENLESSADWTKEGGGVGAWAVVSNEIKSTKTASYYVHETATGDEDMYAQLVITGHSGTNNQAGPQCRMDPGSGDGDGYLMMVDWGDSKARLRRTDGTSRTTLAATTATVPSEPFTLYVEASGSDIEGQIVGTETITATDSTYSGASADHGGVYGHSNSAWTTADSFEAGPLGATPVNGTASPSALNPSITVTAAGLASSSKTTVAINPSVSLSVKARNLLGLDPDGVLTSGIGYGTGVGFQQGSSAGDATASVSAIAPSITVGSTAKAASSAAPNAIEPNVEVSGSAAADSIASPSAINLTVEISSSANGVSHATAASTAINPTIEVDAGAVGVSDSTASPSAINPTVVAESPATADSTASPSAINPNVVISTDAQGDSAVTPSAISPSVTVDSDGQASSLVTPSAITPTITAGADALAGSAASAMAISPSIEISADS